jgi:Flp pilus assembly pilin Flp
MARRSGRGQGLVEYALMLSLIAVVAIGGLLFLGKHVQSSLSNTGTTIGAPAGLLNGGNGNGQGDDNDDQGGNGNGNGNGHGHGNGH